ncbi:MAG TPA: ABC transporter permease [Streptosporangiaceae bacterium]|jgi:ABC-type lipoprotein release transport system permease subunit|nr:ABC transporter permease [Streptosporangiaceae bacterium]
MFITYLLRELRRRMRQAIFIALGLALGVGLVITVMATSSGVSATQGTVLRSLYGVGTDITVTRSPTAGSGGAPHFRFGGGSGQKSTGLSRNVLIGGGLGTLKSSSVTTVASQKDVSSAVGALVLNDLRLSGKLGASPGSSGSISTSTFSVTGVDPASDALGPLASGTITSGHAITDAEAHQNVAVVDANYARSQTLKVGSRISVAGQRFTVVGVVRAAQGVTDADVYIPLARAQSLAGMSGEVNTIYVAASSATDISKVSGEVSRALPGATVTTSSDLASQVTGSLSSASTLANSLGKWLAVAVLAAAFGLASILTVSAVSRRVREFGTLKAIGWTSRRIIGQVIGEALVIGVIGGAAGVAIGYGTAAIVQAVAPPLTATTTTSSSGASAHAGGFARPAAATHTISVHLTAPVTLGAIALAVLLAIAGGLLAGSFGGWRAARLRPAAALSRVE